MTRSMRALVVVPLAALSLALAAPAFADDVCDPLDATCVVTGTAGSGQDQVTDTVDTVTGTVKPVVDDPQGTVDHILHGTVNPPGGGGGGGGGGTGGGGTGGDQPGGHGAAGRPGGTGPHVVRGPQQPGSVGGRPAGPHPTGSTPDTSSVPVTVVKNPVLADGFVGAAAHVVTRSLGVVLALLAVAVGFVTVQDRLDRRDPKLTLAPVQTEMMEFS
ncbi:MAG TPA: hypothetical protein VHN56_10305 [Actinomycetota bacterium]|jgi:hypothetical protein|nr:hypothetical protein [Actinomycetota bacterium]